MPDRNDRRLVDAQKKAWDELTKQWLDEKFAAFGRFTLRSIGAVLFVLFIKFIFALNANDLRNYLETAKQAHQLIE